MSGDHELSEDPLNILQGLSAAGGGSVEKRYEGHQYSKKSVEAGLQQRGPVAGTFALEAIADPLAPCRIQCIPPGPPGGLKASCIGDFDVAFPRVLDPRCDLRGSTRS